MPNLPTTPPTATQLLVALWRLKKELDSLDWATLDLTQEDRDEARTTWANIVASLKAGLSQTQDPPP